MIFSWAFEVEAPGLEEAPAAFCLTISSHCWTASTISPNASSFNARLICRRSSLSESLTVPTAAIVFFWISTCCVRTTPHPIVGRRNPFSSSARWFPPSPDLLFQDREDQPAEVLRLVRGRRRFGVPD